MSSLALEPDPTDEALRALFEGIDGLNFHDGEVTDSDNNAKTVGAPLPYVLWIPGSLFDPNPRLGGHGGWLSMFRLEHVGASSRSCKNLLNGMRSLLDGAELVVDGKSRRIRLYTADQGQNIQPDQTWTRPDGGPLFSVWDTYHVL